MNPEELIEYFENRDLPASYSMPGMKINNCRIFVNAQKLRIQEGVPLIQRVAAEALEKFKAELEKVPNT